MVERAKYVQRLWSCLYQAQVTDSLKKKNYWQEESREEKNLGLWTREIMQTVIVNTRTAILISVC